MASGRRSRGVAFEDLFDPDIVGDGPTAAGYRSGGVLLRFAAIKYGTKRADVGYRVNDVDVSNLWAAKGTASYTLPFNGNTYTAAYNIPNGGSGYALIGFRIVGGNTWQVYSSLNGAAASVLASGAIPAGAATVRYTWGAYTVGVGQTDAGGATTNGAAARTAVSSNPDAHYQTDTVTSTSGSRARDYLFTVDFFNAAASSISHSVCHLIADTEGSV